MQTITHMLGELLHHRQRKKKVPTLGGRELDIMRTLWQGDSLSAQQLMQSTSGEYISLSTMQSTLERLHRKNLLFREKSGRFYVYRAAISRSDFITQLLGDIAEKISDGDMAPMISGFMNFVEQEAPNSIGAEIREAIQGLPTEKDD